MTSDVIARAWAAGLFEGEGCFSMNRDPRPNSRARALVAALTMTDGEVVKQFAQIVGVGTTTYRETDNPNWKSTWRWRCRGRDVETLFAIIGPWLGRRRRDRFEELLAERREYEAGKHAYLSIVARNRARRNLEQERLLS